MTKLTRYNYSKWCVYYRTISDKILHVIITESVYYNVIANGYSSECQSRWSAERRQISGAGQLFGSGFSHMRGGVTVNAVVYIQDVW